VFKAQHRARLTLRWRGGSLTDIDVDLPRQKPAIVRTDDDTIALVRRLAAYYPLSNEVNHRSLSRFQD
jgi:hypothetical protein